MKPRRSICNWELLFSVLFLSAASALAQDLYPAKPHEYLEQGEIRASQSRSPEDIRIAREVLAMGALVAARQGEHLLASSCCIAIASTYEPHEPERQSLWDLALLLSPMRETQWLTHRGVATSRDAHEQAAEAIRLLRNGEYAQASKILQRERVREEINRAAEQLGIQRANVWQLINEMTTASSNGSCSGKYFQVEIVDGKAYRRVCTLHPWAIGAAPNLDQLKVLLGIESVCADRTGTMDDWGGAYELSITQPVTLPSLDWLQNLYKLDPSRPVLKGDRWVSEP